MPHWIAAVWFIAFGVMSCGAGISLITNFRDWGDRWEDGVNARSEYIGKLLHLRRPPNPIVGRVWRPVAGILATLVGLGMVATVLSGELR